MKTCCAGMVSALKAEWPINLRVALLCKGLKKPELHILCFYCGESLGEVMWRRKDEPPNR